MSVPLDGHPGRIVLHPKLCTHFALGCVQGSERTERELRTKVAALEAELSEQVDAHCLAAAFGAHCVG